MLATAISRSQLCKQLRDLGVEPGSVLLVHTSFSKIKPVEDGAGINCRITVGSWPTRNSSDASMTEDDDHPFDSKTTPCIGMGIVSDMFWRLPGVLRSDNPSSFAAVGEQAVRTTAPHPIDPPHGLNSPVGRVYELDGQVLLPGVGHDVNTTIHLAESLAGVRYRRKKYGTVIKEE